MSTHTGDCHSGKQCTAVPTSHYLPTAKRTWQAMLVFIHPCNLVGKMPQTPERFQRNRLRSCGAEHRSILKSESGIFRLTAFRKIRFFLISVDCHLAKVSAHILYTKLRHPRLYQAELFFIYEEFDLYRSLAIPVVWHRCYPAPVQLSLVRSEMLYCVCWILQFGLEEFWIQLNVLIKRHPHQPFFAAAFHEAFADRRKSIRHFHIEEKRNLINQLVPIGRHQSEQADL